MNYRILLTIALLLSVPLVQALPYNATKKPSAPILGKTRAETRKLKDAVQIQIAHDSEQIEIEATRKEAEHDERIKSEQEIKAEDQKNAIAAKIYAEQADHEAYTRRLMALVETIGDKHLKLLNGSGDEAAKRRRIKRLEEYYWKPYQAKLKVESGLSRAARLKPGLKLTATLASMAPHITESYFKNIQK